MEMFNGEERDSSSADTTAHARKKIRKVYLCKNMKFLPLVCEKLINVYFCGIWTEGNH